MTHSTKLRVISSSSSSLRLSESNDLSLRRSSRVLSSFDCEVFRTEQPEGAEGLSEIERMKNQISKVDLSSTIFSSRKNGAGFTIIELMISISIFVIIAGVAIVSLNPIGQFSKARNTQRELHLQALMSAVRQNISDSGTGAFACAAGSIPTSTKRMAIGAGNYDIAGCLVPTYITTLPFDPSTSTAHYTSNADYDTGYTIIQATSTGAITLSAPATELKKTSSTPNISITR